MQFSEKTRKALTRASFSHFGVRLKIYVGTSLLTVLFIPTKFRHSTLRGYKSHGPIICLKPAHNSNQTKTYNSYTSKILYVYLRFMIVHHATFLYATYLT